MQTVVGLYKTVEDANTARQALLNQGYNGGDVTVIDQSEGGYGQGGYGQGAYGSGSTAGSGVTGVTGSNESLTGTSTSQYGGAATATDDTGVGAKIKHFFEGLTGHDEHTHAAYTQGLSSGGALVAVSVNDDEADRAANILRSNGASDIDEGDATGTGANYAGSNYKDENYGSTERTGNAAISGEQVIPIVEEELVVGKRQVQRGGVRVYSRVVSEPVTESVRLHDERIVVDRHAVNRPATEADFAEAGPIELRAMGEEAVVGKSGRVVEEVVVGKTASDRTETINDTVRRTEVDVEPIAGETTTSRSTSARDTDSNKY